MLDLHLTNLLNLNTRGRWIFPRRQRCNLEKWQCHRLDKGAVIKLQPVVPKMTEYHWKTLCCAHTATCSASCLHWLCWPGRKCRRNPTPRHNLHEEKYCSKSAGLLERMCDGNVISMLLTRLAKTWEGNVKSNRTHWEKTIRGCHSQKELLMFPLGKLHYSIIAIDFSYFCAYQSFRGRKDRK